MYNRIASNSALAKAAEMIAPGKAVGLSGVWGAAAPMLAGALARRMHRPVLYVCSHLDDADDAAEDMEQLAGVAPLLLPAWEADAHTEHVSDEVAAQRLKVCRALAGGEAAPVVIAPILAMMQPVPSPQLLAESGLTIRPGLELSPEALAQWLVDAGFESAEMVDQVGQFARRGGIVDVLAPGETLAVRIEFFGDEVESLRAVDLDTQRSVREVDRIELAAISAGREYDPAKTVSLLEHLPPETIVCLFEPAELGELAETFYSRITDTTGMHSPADLFGRLGRFAVAELSAFGGSPAEQIDFGIASIQRLSTRVDDALAELAELSREAEATVYCETPAEASRFEQLLAQHQPAAAERVATAEGHISRGFHWPGERVAIVGHHEIFHRHTQRRKLRRVRAGRPIDSFIDLQEGDYVVHVGHGIARFEGLRRLETDGADEEFLTLRFADNALLHVPTSQIGLVQKYIGSTKTRPRLSKLGGAAWTRQKQRVAEAVKDLAAEMIRVQAMREATPGVAYPEDTVWQQQFEQEFPYTETEDQLAGAAEIKRDLQAHRPMDRLLCGDVGFGKTELAIRAAFKVVQAGRQAAVLVPTTVLADQHLRTFRERLADYPVTVEMISRFRSKGEQEQIAKRLVTGQIDILIGTHRLLSDDIRFADLGLVVIDEEQRFGVTHKERLKHMRATVDVLTMTATPIPRTLHMALLGLRDISNLTTPPLDRRAIHTEVARRDDRRIREAILRELNREGQVYFVHNRVHNIEKMAETIRALVPEASVIVGHGQMPPGQLEKVMLDFVRGHYDVLVCTTIIESGLDIPRANTMFIHEADRFGLAELHQLRGRVGRYKHRAYCYLLLPERRSVSPIAAKRLKAIEEFSDLGAGFQIAMRDLEIRGAGNILGPEQSGHIATVGYELYCDLLAESVRRLKGEKPKPKRDVTVDLGVSAYIPRGYIPSDRQRMEVYRRIVHCEDLPALTQLRADLEDAYGPAPIDADVLLQLAEIRILAGALGFDSVVLMRPDVIFSATDLKLADRALKGASGSVRMPDKETIHWRMPKGYIDEPATLLAVLRRQLQQGVSAG